MSTANTPNKTKQVEITVSVTGKIPRRNFENYAPMFVVKEIMQVNGGYTDDLRQTRQKELHHQCEILFNEIRDSILLEELQTQFKNLRFTVNPADGKKYPHVTDIIYWDENFYISPDELMQYAARGTAIHDMIDHYIKSKEWTEKAIHNRDLIILKKGSKNLYPTLPDINFLAFMEKYGNDIKFTEGEFRAFSQEHRYTGKPDRIGVYQGLPAIFDFKCREAKDRDFVQMAAYLNMDNAPLQSVKFNKGVMVIIPLNPSNKSGYGKPVVSAEIERYFNEFLRDRQDFKERFGV